MFYTCVKSSQTKKKFNVTTTSLEIYDIGGAYNNINHDVSYYNFIPEFSRRLTPYNEG